MKATASEAAERKTCERATRSVKATTSEEANATTTSEAQRDNASPQTDTQGERAATLACVGLLLQRLVPAAEVLPPDVAARAVEDGVLVAKVNAVLAAFRSSSTLQEWKRLLGHVVAFKDARPHMDACPAEEAVLLWLESLSVSPATRHGYAKNLRAVIRRYAPTEELSRLNRYVDSYMRAGATQPTRQAPPCTHDEADAVLRRLPAMFAAMASLQLTMGTRSVDLTRMEDLAVLSDTGTVVTGTVWLRMEKNNLPREPRRKPWAACGVQREVLLTWLAGRTVVQGFIFGCAGDERRGKALYDEYLSAIKRCSVLTTHSLKRSHHRRMALALPDMPDSELKEYTGHQSESAMFRYIGPEIRELRQRARITSAQLLAQAVRE